MKPEIKNKKAIKTVQWMLYSGVAVQTALLFAAVAKDTKWPPKLGD